MQKFKFNLNAMKIRCNNCYWTGEFNDLKQCEDEGGIFKGCPNCEKDGYLMDMEDMINHKPVKIDIDNESLHIFVDHGEDKDPTSICYWHIDEVEEDASVAFAMLRAVQLYYTDKQKLVDLLNLRK